MKKAALFLSVILIACLLGGCHGESQTEKEISIPFKEGQLYAAAYLGYLEVNDMEYYTENFLGGSEVPVHYVSQGEYYLPGTREHPWSFIRTLWGKVKFRN